MAQPMVGGIYTADPETLSLRATLPRFLDMEREHRSLILAMMRQGREQKAGRAARVTVCFCRSIEECKCWLTHLRRLTPTFA